MAEASSLRIARVVSSRVREPAPGTWSNCLVVDGIAYLAGMIARGDDGLVVGDEYQQAKVIFAKIGALLEAAGGAMADVVRLAIYVTDIAQREKVWRARREVFTAARRLEQGPDLGEDHLGLLIFVVPRLRPAPRC